MTTNDERKEIIINTNGWTDVVCDKCGSCTSFDPSIKFEDMNCMACDKTILVPEGMNIDEFIKRDKL